MKQFHYHAFYAPSDDLYESGWVSGDMETDDQCTEEDVVEMLQENEYCRVCWVYEFDDSLYINAFETTVV